MGLEDVAKCSAGATETDASEGGGFWKSLQGILTAAAGLVAAITGLVIGLNQAGLLGQGKTPSAQIDRPSPEQDQKAPAPDKPDQSNKPTSALLLGAGARWRLFRPRSARGGRGAVLSRSAASTSSCVRG